MNKKDLELLNGINHAIIKFRGLYSAWAKKMGISYHEQLVLYTLREYGYCTQKKICDSYLLPKQTINNVISDLRRRGLLSEDERESKKEKVFILTEKGKEVLDPLLKEMNEIESNALTRMGKEKLLTLITLLNEYDEALRAAIKEGGR